jgi:hypothetical protein
MKYFRYTLTHSIAGSKVLNYAPQEWASDSAFWERSMTYWGIFRSFSTKELSIIKDGATWLKNIFDTYGTEAEVTYKVETLNPSTYSYDVTYTGILDFTSYKYEDRGRYDVVNIQVIDDNFTNTIKTRESVDVPLNKLFDLDGSAITPFTDEGISVTVPDRYDIYYATLYGQCTSISTNNPFSVGFTSREEESIISALSPTGVGNGTAGFFKPLYSTALNIHITMGGSVVMSYIATATVYLRRYNSSNVLQSSVSIETHSVEEEGGTVTFSVDDDFTISSIASGDYVELQLQLSDNITSANVTFTATVNYNKLVLSAFTFKGYPYHEAFTRILQSITGDANPFYSTLLGRTDSEITAYTSNGALSMGVVTNGLAIRGFTLGTNGVNLNTSLRSLFNTLSAIYPICMGVCEVSSVKKVIIENLAYAFDEHYFLTIENCSNITEEVAVDLTFSSLAIGFSKAESQFNEMKALFEYNTTSHYISKLTRHQNEFNRVAPYRADGNAIIFARQYPATTHATENTAYDDSVFVISTYDASGTIRVKEDDGYTSVAGVDNPTQSYNLDYAPARSLMRWGSFLRGCLEKYTSSILAWVSSGKPSSMSSQQTGESTPIYESVNINVSDLGDPFFENIYYTFSCVVSNAMIALLNGTATSGKPLPYYIVRFRSNASESYRYGWIMKIEARKEGNKGLGTFKLLKVNTTYVTPTATSVSYTADNNVLTADSTTITSDTI